jgi:hypothetical protein
MSTAKLKRMNFAELMATLPAESPHGERQAAGTTRRTGTVAADNNRGSAQICEGQRNATLTSLAGSMRRRGMAPEAIVSALLIQNRAKCDPPLPKEEIMKCSIGRPL